MMGEGDKQISKYLASSVPGAAVVLWGPRSMWAPWPPGMEIGVGEQKPLQSANPRLPMRVRRTRWHWTPGSCHHDKCLRGKWANRTILRIFSSPCGNETSNGSWKLKKEREERFRVKEKGWENMWVRKRQTDIHTHAEGQTYLNVKALDWF